MHDSKSRSSRLSRTALCDSFVKSSGFHLKLYFFLYFKKNSLFQVLTYKGFYDTNLEWVGLEGVQIVASMTAGSGLGRHKLSSRFTSVVRICAIEYVQLLLFLLFKRL